MSLYVRNIQKMIIFSIKQLESDMNILRIAANIQKHDLGVLCCDPNYMEQLQKDVGGNLKRGVPLVIGFPYNEKSAYWSSGSMPEPKVEWNLGDIVLNIPAIFDTSKQEHRNLYSSLAIASAQGISELLVPGDHSEDHLHKVMDKECEILDNYNRLTKADLPLPTYHMVEPKLQASAH